MLKLAGIAEGKLMISPCDICVENLCNGKGGCNCEECDKKSRCARYRGLKPTIRITTKCTQKCSHCCFSCGPKESKMMSLEMAENIHKFLKSNNIKQAEIMGGEFFLNPDWENIMDIIGKGLNSVRVVTAGDWAASKKLSQKIISFLINHNNFHVGLSKDKWHTNKNVKLAIKYLKENNIPHKIQTQEQGSEEALVPVGRNRFEYGFYSSFGYYCGNPTHMYSFLIDEGGKIYKCGFGVWDYADVIDYVDGGFNKKFKEFGLKFYNTFIPNCKVCEHAYNSKKKEDY